MAQDFWLNPIKEDIDIEEMICRQEKEKEVGAPLDCF